ncbi:MAG: M16 family metallopeptidase [Candidatus Polarisedimenticolia bacterium]
MSRLLLAPVAVALLSVLPVGAAPPAEAPPADPRLLTYGSLAVSFPKPGKVFLPNGLLVYLFEDHELPIVDLSFYVRAGSIYDPPDKTGLAEVAATLMRTGGTRDLGPDAVDETLEFLPATLNVGADRDALFGGLSALKPKFPEALRILAGVLMSPRFDEERLRTEKARMEEGLRRRWDDPGTIAALQFRLLAYGADSPWARLVTAASIGRIGRDDLVGFHRRYLHPNNAVFGIAGDFDPKAMTRLLEETFGGWSRAKITPPAVPRVADTVPAGLHLVRKPLPQTSVRLGHLGLNRFHPDKFPVKILNFILGDGGFSSRLVREVRSTRGLAYSVWGAIGLDTDRGLFEVGTRTRPGTTLEAIEAVREILADLRRDGPTDQEVREAKEAETNSFVFSVDGTVPFMNAFLYYDYNGYPPDYLTTYRDRLAKVTRAEVQRVAREHLRPDRLVVLVVGDDAAFGRPLAALGLGEPRLIRLEAPAAAR